MWGIFLILSTLIAGEPSGLVIETPKGYMNMATRKPVTVEGMTLVPYTGSVVWVEGNDGSGKSSTVAAMNAWLRETGNTEMIFADRHPVITKVLTELLPSRLPPKENFLRPQDQVVLLHLKAKTSKARILARSRETGKPLEMPWESDAALIKYAARYLGLAIHYNWGVVDTEAYNLDQVTNLLRDTTALYKIRNPNTFSMAEFEALPLIAAGNSKVIRRVPGTPYVLVRYLSTVHSFKANNALVVPDSARARMVSTQANLYMLQCFGVKHDYLYIGEHFILAQYIPNYFVPRVEVVVKRAYQGSDKHRYFGLERAATIATSVSRADGVEGAEGETSATGTVDPLEVSVEDPLTFSIREGETTDFSTAFRCELDGVETKTREDEVSHGDEPVGDGPTLYDLSSPATLGPVVQDPEIGEHFFLYPRAMVRFDWRNPNQHPTIPCPTHAELEAAVDARNTAAVERHYETRAKARLQDQTLYRPLAAHCIKVKQAEKTALQTFNAMSTYFLDMGVLLLDICFFITTDGEMVMGEISSDNGRYKDLAVEWDAALAAHQAGAVVPASSPVELEFQGYLDNQDSVSARRSIGKMFQKAVRGEAADLNEAWGYLRKFQEAPGAAAGAGGAQLDWISGSGARDQDKDAFRRNPKSNIGELWMKFALQIEEYVAEHGSYIHAPGKVLGGAAGSAPESDPESAPTESAPTEP